MEKKKIDQYFERIGYTDKPKIDYSTLKKVQELQASTIPFENIDSFCSIVPSLNINAIFQKLIIEKRGGYCYELNLLLKSILKEIGFNVDFHLARVRWKKDTDAISPRTHLILIITLNNLKYLVDPAFGTAILSEPLLIDNFESQKTANGFYKIVYNSENYELYFLAKDWLPVYSFNVEKTNIKDLEIANWYLATNPSSGFVNNLMISKINNSTVYSLNNHIYTIRNKNGDKITSTIESINDFLLILKNTFNLTITEASLEKCLISKLFHN